MEGVPMTNPVSCEDSKQQSEQSDCKGLRSHQQPGETTAEVKNTEAQLDSCLEPLSKKAKLSVASGQADCLPIGMVHIIPRPATPSFTGRDKELATLDAAVVNRTHQHVVNIAITGPPGVGKTELALKFIELHSAEFHHILWINCYNKSTIINSFQNFASKLGVIDENYHINDEIELKLLLSRVYNAVKLCKTMFVFDNAISSNDIQKFILPESSVFVVTTSQCVTWDCDVTLPVECFTELAAKNFLSQHLISSRDGDLTDLCKILEYSPLALQVVASIIKQLEKTDNEKFTIDNFILFYKGQESKILYYSCPNTNTSLCDSTSLLSTFSQAVQNLKQHVHGPLAIRILNLVSFIKPENIPKSMFKNLSGAEEAIGLLKECSLIKCEEENFSLGKFLHQTLIIINKSQVDVLFELLTLLMKDIVIHESGADFSVRFMAEHAEQAWKYVGNTDELVTKFSLIAVAASSDVFMFEHIDSLERILGWHNEHFLQIQLKNVLEKSKLDSDREEAIILCDKALIVIQEMNYNITMKFLYLMNKAWCLQHMEKFKEAWKIFQEVYEEKKALLGLDHSDTLETLSNMRETLSELAEKSEFEAMETWLSFMDERIDDHRLDYKKTLEAFGHIVDWFHPGDKKDDVLELFEKFHKTLVTLVGESHESTWKILLYKSKFLKQFEIYEESMEVLMLCNQKQIDNNLDNIETIKNICFTAPYVTNKAKAWQFCFSLIEKRINKPCHDHLITLELLDYIDDQVLALKLHDMLLVVLKTSSVLDKLDLMIQTLHSKVQCLINLHDYYEAWNTLIIIHLKLADLNRDNASTVFEMCSVSILLRNVVSTQFCHSVLKEKARDRQQNPEHTLRLLHKCTEMMASENMLATYDLFYDTVVELSGPESPLALLTQLSKAGCCLYIEGRDKEAWKIYNQVCLVLEKVPITRQPKVYCITAVLHGAIDSLRWELKQLL